MVKIFFMEYLQIKLRKIRDEIKVEMCVCGCGSGSPLVRQTSRHQHLCNSQQSIFVHYAVTSIVQCLGCVVSDLCTKNLSCFSNLLFMSYCIEYYIPVTFKKDSMKT